MKLLKLAAGLLMATAVVACNSGMNVDPGDARQTVGNDVADSNSGEPKIIRMTDRRNETFVEISGTEQVSGFLEAWRDRVRSYEKIKPLFEYSVRFEHDGMEEHWRVNRAGYCMQEGSSELYKMSTEALHEYMN